MAESQPRGRAHWWRHHWLVLVLSAVGLIGLVAYAVLAATVLPVWIVSVSATTADENHRLDAIVNTRGALLGVLAPVVVAIGAVAAFLNYRETSAQNRRTVELSRDTLDVTRRGQLTDRFTRAIEQLGQTGEDKLDIRLGGIYALEQISKESAELHRPVMEILTAFLREHSQPAETVPKQTDNQVSPPRPSDEATEHAMPLRADFQAIATVLGRRNLSRDRVDFGLDLRGVALNRVYFAGAQLQEANFERAHLWPANFAGAHLREANFQRAQLWHADFDGAHLQRARFDGAHLQGASFAGAQLQRAYFGGAELHRATFGDAQLQGALFGAARLQQACFLRAQLQRAYFERAQLAEVYFERARLQEASFVDAKIVGANFERAQLKAADFAYADLEGARFRRGETDEYDALGLTPEQLDRARNVDKAVLPHYMAAAPESTRNDRPTEEQAKSAPTVSAESRGPLTRREMEIARLIAKDLSNREIATQLFVSERTVETHVTNMLNRLRLSSRIQIARWLAGTSDADPTTAGTDA